MLNCYFKKGTLGMILFFSSICFSYAQSPVINSTESSVANATKEITLNVVDDFGKPLQGVRVSTTTGSEIGFTDENGNLIISGQGIKQIVLVSPNFISKTVNLSQKDKLTVKLTVSYLSSPEKVQVLYSEQSPKEILGAVSYVNNQQIKSTPTSLYLNALTGRLPGFYTEQYSGFRTAKTQPITRLDLAGWLPNEATKYSSNISDNSEISYNLRGQQPVTIVDGVQRDIYSLDPENIESITVLKDALSTLLLGQRSSRGVLEVITKKGVVGPPRISFTAQTGMQSALKTPKPLNSYQYAYLYNEALQNSGRTLAYNIDEFNAFKNKTSPLLYPDVNWYDEILKDNNPITKYSLNVNGGIKNARYSLGLGYLSQEGMFKSDDALSYQTNLELSRYLINSNIDVDATKNFNIGLQLFGRIQDGRQPGATTAGILSQLYNTPNNVYPVFNNDGTYGGASNYTNNLYQQATGSGYLLDNSRDLLANLDLKYKFDNWLPGLYAKGKINVSSTSSSLINRSRSQPVYDLSLNSSGDFVSTRYGLISDQQNSFNSTSTAQFFYAQAAIGYETTIGDNNLSGMLFTDQQTSTYQFDLPFKYTNYAATAKYNFKKKYFAEAALNYSGFDRFQPGNQFGLFYAGGLGWDISEEAFIKDNAKWVNQLKLRATYGKTGNSNENALGYFTWRSAFGQDGSNSYPSGTGYNSVFGLIEKGLANVNATWEKANKLNIGLDGAFFNQHLSFTVDFYRDAYSDLLQQRGSNSEIIGMVYPNENIGKNLYQGQELSITYQNHLGNFNYFITANASRMKTEVIDKNELLQKYSWNRRTGMPVGQTFGYLANGLIQTQAEADQAPLLAGTKVYPGDVKLVDLNTDGIIDQFDETALGNTKPVVYYGTTLGFNVKGFDVSVLLQGVKNRTYQQTDYSFGSGGQSQGYEYLLGRWTPETATTATYPRLTLGFNANNTPFLNNSSYWTHSGEYFRVKNVDLGYTLPYNITKKLKIAGLRLFMSGQNLFTETAYERLDPEVYGNASYPIQRTISAGVNIKL
ncbi:SusC/RagA family TonB-linked outer membrane protein [Pedobacter arcticus]|uniref:SusC/RagA family TonB-linked outer membrane protein n=1 Tax=Pedobacter arcticus TaxID=752140 RepID=UPI00031709AC|nr:SusC/RagA family TonB-linked outer membrane protein [Pedobacter arcticus]